MVLAAEDYSTWTYSFDVTLNTASSGANVTANVAGFPVLIRFNSDNFIFSEVRAGGQDIRFAKPDGTPLDYQIERWDSAHALAEVWVKTDVSGSQPDQKLRMYWGNAAAADSSDGGSTFSEGYAQVWHLGDPGTMARANAVSGGLPATPMNYEGTESEAGLIGLADNFDGETPGDYLDLGDGYTEFGNGFTYSVWAYPTARKKWNHLLDLGNGAPGENIILNRVDTTNDMALHNYNGATATGILRTKNVWALNQWQYFVITVSGKNAKLYKNGLLIDTATLTNTISTVSRTENFIAKSNWATDDYYQGKLDEPELSKVARSDAWIKLSYQNQKANQSLVTVKLPNRCQSAFTGPADTSGNEGATLNLLATTQCATSFAWTVVSGPAPKILDPEVKILSVTLPRVTKDTAMVYRFTAVYPDSSSHKDVRILIKESIPDPDFTMPADPNWNGTDLYKFRPTINNIPAIIVTRDSVINWAWTLTGPAADTLWLKDGLLLKSAAAGKLQVKLCLDNGGAPICKTSTVTVTGGLSFISTTSVKVSQKRALIEFDAVGRKPAGQIRSHLPRYHRTEPARR